MIGLLTSSSFLLTISHLLFFTATFAQTVIPVTSVEARINSSVILKCKMARGNQQCTWKHNQQTNYTKPNTFTRGYSVVGNPLKGVCDLNIHSVKLQDHGRWECNIAGNKESQTMNLTLVKRPDCFLEYRGDKISRDKIAPVLTHLGAFQVVCEARGSMSKANITWEGKGIYNSSSYYEESSHGPKEDGTYDVRSVVTVKMPQNSREKTTNVTCIIAYSKRLDIRTTATFGEEYGTTNVSLTSIPGANKNEFILSCVANGLPEPSYYIMMITSNNKTRDPAQGQNRTVTGGGTYVCLAGNYHNKQLIKSEEVPLEPPENDWLNGEADLAQTGIYAFISLIVVATIAATGGSAYYFWKNRDKNQKKPLENISHQKIETGKSDMEQGQEETPLT